MTIPIRGIWMDAPMRAALAEYAYLRRASMAEIVRAAVRDVIDGAADKSALSTDDARSEVHLNVKIPDDIWRPALAAARTEGVSLTSLIRRRVRKVLQSEGLL